MNRNLRNRGDGVPRPGQGPDLDRPDIQFGERKMVEDGLKAVPLPRGATPTPRGGGGSPATQARRGGGPPPPQAFEMPSKRPNESLATAPPMMDLSPREQILEYFVGAHSNRDAVRMLKEIRGVREADTPRVAPPPPPEQVSPPGAGTLPDPMDDEMDDGPQITDLDLSPVEEPSGSDPAVSDEEGNQEVPLPPAAPPVGEPAPEAPVE